MLRAIEEECLWQVWVGVKLLDEIAAGSARGAAALAAAAESWTRRKEQTLLRCVTVAVCCNGQMLCTVDALTAGVGGTEVAGARTRTALARSCAGAIAAAAERRWRLRICVVG